jgi:hypothetical protein
LRRRDAGSHGLTTTNESAKSTADTAAITRSNCQSKSGTNRIAKSSTDGQPERCTVRNTDPEWDACSLPERGAGERRDAVSGPAGRVLHRSAPLSNIHVLTRDGNAYHLVLHISTPAGNNAAGMTWAAAYVAAFAPKTVLPSGDGTLGTINTTEAAAILAGTLLEMPFDFTTGTSFEAANGAAQLAEIDRWYSSVTNTRLLQLQAQLLRFGLTLS